MDPLSDTTMMVEPEDYETVEEKMDVAEINPAQLDEEENEQVPTADDYEAIKAKILPPTPDLETEAEAVHTWTIESWRSLAKREHGPEFECGGCPWRVLFFPYGNNVDFASFYLEHANEKPPPDWYACVEFALVLWNPNDPSIYVTHTAHHRFTAEEGDWGFTRFAELRKLFGTKWEDHGRPMVEEDKANITSYVRIVKDPTGVLWHNLVNYDSKKQTGFVGLRNQGATCYLNSLLQSLYFTNAFRKAVYKIPTEDEETLSNSAYTLQRLFYLLQTSEDAVPTAELTRSFGWETKHIFEQQDVQELSRILMERLEEKMKGTEAENALSKLFVGKTKTYISCINVNYESSRIEDFWDIQLNVSNNKNLDESFKDYIQVETMNGDNKYFAEGHGLQDAKKGVIFESFPQVLHLQLKRFEYDINRDAMMKVNDRHEFPEKFDASPYLSEDADRSESYIYHLHGVLVHSGDFNAGHYYAFIKPTKDGHFYKFDDDRVTRATMREVLEDNYGGDYDVVNGTTQMRNPYTRTTSIKRSMSAYMLVYIRETRLNEVLPDVSQEDTPPHLEKKINEERLVREQRRREREEQYMYMYISVISDQSFEQYQGLDLASWESDAEDEPAKPKTHRVLREKTMKEITEMVASDLGKDPSNVRLWAMVNRQNHTVRPDQPLTDLQLTVQESHAKHGTKTPSYRLWAEVREDGEDKPSWPEPATPGTGPQSAPILLFLKHFDSETQTLKGVGHLYIGRHEKVSELAQPILQRMKWPAGTALKLYEEIKPSMIEPMKTKQSLHQAEIQDGDIICFQKSLSEKETSAIVQSGGYAEAKEFYSYLLNRITVNFSPYPGQSREDLPSFDLLLSKRMNYEQFSAKVGDHLQVDPTHLRFFPINSQTLKAKPALRRTPTTTLQQVLSPQYIGSTAQMPNALYYEALELSLTELETKKPLKVTWLSEGITKEETFDILVPKHGIMADVKPILKAKANLDEDTAERIRLYETHGHRLYKELSDDFSVVGVNEFVSLYAEAIPTEELEADDDSRVISVFHFSKEPNKAHGVPFIFLVKPDEQFKDTRERLEKRTGIKGKQFEKIKFALIQRSAYSKPFYLNDDAILYDLASSSDDLLGLDHVDRSRGVMNGRGDAIFIR